MPLYEYECSCGKISSEVRSIKDKSKPTIPCEACGLKAARIYSMGMSTGWADDWSAEDGGKGRLISQFGLDKRQRFNSPEDVKEYAKTLGMTTYRT